MQKIIATVLSSVLVVTLSACATGPNNEQGGQMIGGVLGGVLGSQVGGGNGRTAAIIAGTVAGALIGGSIGRTMDSNDRMKAQNAFEYNRSNEPTSWRNPDSGNAYTVTPTRTYTARNSGESCRDYTTDAVINGRHEIVHGTACRQADGSWRSAS
ncbi:MAG: RT0821/Lpp0805 family surface protein [Gammaproteobacteria bacterium]